jgi:hypothetical protein
MTVHLVAPHLLIDALGPDVAGRVRALPAEAVDDESWHGLVAALAAGDSLIAIGTDALRRLRPLWVSLDDCPATGLRRPEATDVEFPEAGWSPAACRGLSVRPDTVHAYFGREEMPRADLVPLLEAVDGSGHPCAYAAVLLKHNAPTLAGGRFGGSNWYLFAFDDPLAAATAAEWAAVVRSLADHAEAAVHLTSARAHYSCHRPGERVLVNVGVAGRLDGIAAVRLELDIHVV